VVEKQTPKEKFYILLDQLRTDEGKEKALGIAVKKGLIRPNKSGAVNDVIEPADPTQFTRYGSEIISFSSGKDDHKVELGFSVQEIHALNVLVEKTGLPTKEEVIKRALSLFNFCFDRVISENQLMLIGKNKTYAQIAFPFFEESKSEMLNVAKDYEKMGAFGHASQAYGLMGDNERSRAILDLARLLDS
jgi:hypothetical protein